MLGLQTEVIYKKLQPLSHPQVYKEPLYIPSQLLFPNANVYDIQIQQKMEAFNPYFTLTFKLLTLWTCTFVLNDL